MIELSQKILMWEINKGTEQLRKEKPKADSTRTVQNLLILDCFPVIFVKSSLRHPIERQVNEMITFSIIFLFPGGQAGIQAVKVNLP